jgi:hypothetical protein
MSCYRHNSICPTQNLRVSSWFSNFKRVLCPQRSTIWVRLSAISLRDSSQKKPSLARDLFMAFLETSRYLISRQHKMCALTPLRSF